MPQPSTAHRAPVADARLVVATRLLLIAVSALMAILALAAAWLRLRSPFEYDWIEDGMLVSARRIAQGLPLYGPPSAAFTPYLYTPAYPYLAAAATKLFGASYGTLRLVSALGMVGIFGFAYALVFSETRKHVAAVAAAGIFASCYPLLDGSLDLGRVDTLYVLFVAAALLATRRLHPALAALLWVLAFQTKQSVLPVALLALAYDWQRPRRILAGLGSFIALLAASILLLDRATDGWYRFYVFGVAGGFGLSMTQAARFIPQDLVAPFGVALLILFAAAAAAPPRLRSPATSFYAMGTLGMVCFTGYLRAHRGANVNVLAPAYFWIAVLCGISFARLQKRIEAGGARRAEPLLAILMMAATLQMAAHLYSPRQFVQTADETAAHAAFESQLRAIPGEVLVFSHPEDGAAAGKGLYAGTESAGAVIEAQDSERGRALRADYALRFRERRWSAIALDNPPEFYHSMLDPAALAAAYPLRIAAAGAGANRFGSEPRWIYFPCPGGGHPDPKLLFPGAEVDESVCR